MAIENFDQVTIAPAKLRPFSKFIMSIGELPTSYLDSLSYAEQVTWFCDYLQNMVIPALNNNAQALQEVQNLMTELQEYVSNYFDNLDVQEEINNKLDDMVEQGTLQEIIADYLNSKAVFGYDNVASMKSSTNLIDGSYARTLGYYSKNDGGCALYKIREITNDDTVDEMSIIAIGEDNLIAELIINEPLNILQLGAKGDDLTNNDTYFAKAITITKNIYIPTGIFRINTSLTLTDNFIINCDGTIKMTVNLPAIIINGVKNKLNIKNIISTGIGIELLDTNKLNYGNEFNIQSIIATNTGIYLYSTTNGIQYNNFNGNECIGDSDAIKVHVSSSGHHANENRFYNYQTKSTNGCGVKLENERSENQSYVSGNRFINIGFEGVHDAIYLNQAWFNDFTNCRSQESITANHIIFKRRCVCNKIQKDVTPLNLIDKSQITSNSFNNIIEGRINNNNTNNEQITDKIYVSDKGYRYIPLNAKQINTFTLSGDSILLNDIYYNWILAKTDATVKLGYTYCNELMIGRSFTINTGNPALITDVNDKTIIANDSALQGFKNVKVTLLNINPNNGECYWSTELL